MIINSRGEKKYFNSAEEIDDALFNGASSILAIVIISSLVLLAIWVTT